MRRFFPLISIFLLSLFPVAVSAQDSVVVSQPPLSDSIGSKAKYTAVIELPKGYLSGISVIVREPDVYHGVLFNEFGITALEFTYHPRTGKVDLIEVIPMLDKWYVRRVLKSDLQRVMENLLHGISVYKDEKYHVSYSFSLMKDEVEPDAAEGESDGTEE